MARDNHDFAKFNKIGFNQAGNPNPADLHLAWAAGARLPASPALIQESPSGGSSSCMILMPQGVYERSPIPNRDAIVRSAAN